MSRIGPTRGRSISASRMAEYSSAAGRAGEVLVLVGREPPVLEAVAPPQSTPIGSVRRGAVERQADRGPPVDDHRLAARLGHVAPADVEALAVGVVEPPEEQRDGRVVGELAHPQLEGGLEVLPAHPVRRARRVHRRGALPHPPQLRPRPRRCACSRSSSEAGVGMTVPPQGGREWEASTLTSSSILGGRAGCAALGGRAGCADRVLVGRAGCAAAGPRWSSRLRSNRVETPTHAPHPLAAASWPRCFDFRSDVVTRRFGSSGHSSPSRAAHGGSAGRPLSVTVRRGISRRFPLWTRGSEPLPSVGGSCLARPMSSTSQRPVRGRRPRTRRAAPPPSRDNERYAAARPTSASSSSPTSGASCTPPPPTPAPRAWGGDGNLDADESLGGDGTPAVAAFAPEPLGLALGRPHRLPR